MKRTIYLLIPCLFLLACSSSQITATLEATVNALIAADSIARPQDAPTLSVVTSCLDQATTVLAGTATPAIKGATIAADCAAALTASRSNTALAAVSAALSSFLQAVAQTSAQIQFSRPEMVSAFAGSSQGKISQKKLKEIRKKIEKLKKNQK